MTELAVSVGSSIPNSLRIPSSADSVGTFPSGKVFGCPKRRMHNRNYPTSDLTPRWLFNKCYEFAAVGAVRMSPAEAVLAISVSALHGGSALFQRSHKKQKLTARRRTGLNRVNCTTANT